MAASMSITLRARWTEPTSQGSGRTILRFGGERYCSSATDCSPRLTTATSMVAE